MAFVKITVQNWLLYNLKMANGHIPVGIFIDLSKAFDIIDHNILLAKLEFYVVKGLSNELFKKII